MKCINCQSDLREGAKYCSACGTKVTLEEKSNAGIQHANNYLFWHVQPGEIARIINESEFLNYASARGIIINQGTTAVVYSQGTVMDVLHGGKYDFINSKELDGMLDRLSGGWGQVKRFLVRLIYRDKANKKLAADNYDIIKKDAERLEEIIRFVNSGNLFSVVLMQDREFELLFGDSGDTQRPYEDFRPMQIRTPHLDYEIGVRALFKVTNRDVLVQQYLVEKNVLTTETLAKSLAPYVENAVRKSLGNIVEESLDASYMNRLLQSCQGQIEQELRTIDLHGISLQKVLNVTSNNEDIERFRALSHDLYVSEEELNYLNRTNEFKNRLATAVNQQKLQEARTELELMRNLQEINKDGCIDQDELERFYIVLSRERRIFEAQSAETEQKAMDEIHKTRFLRDEELMILKHEAELRRAERETQLEKARLSNGAELQSLSYRNGFALKLMQLKDSIDYERVRTSGEGEINMINVANELGIASRKDAYKDHRFEVELNQTKMKDDYDWTKRQREQEAQNDQVKFALNIAAQSRQMQLDSLKAMNEMESAAKDRDTKRRIEEENARRAHEKEMHAQEVNAKLEEKRIIAGMTKEQIEATQLSSLSESAQVAYVSAGKEKELERALSAQHQLEQEREFRKEQQLREDRLRQEEAARQDNFIRMLVDSTNRSMDTIAIMSGNMVENRNEQRREYRDELHREQERHDAHQDRALNYTTRTMTHSNRPPAVLNICPQCRKKYSSDNRFCDDCGCELEAK